MSVKGDFGSARVTSALPPKADMCSATRDVRFVPIADIARRDPKIDFDQIIARILRISEVSTHHAERSTFAQSRGGPCTGIFSFQQMGLS
jgi:hypothetical protein